MIFRTLSVIVGERTKLTLNQLVVGSIPTSPTTFLSKISVLQCLP